MQGSQIEEIKGRIDIVQLIGGYVKLSKTGINWRGLCPFHSEKGPSFFVNPGRQLFKCFGCGKAGDIFAFIQGIEGIEFGDALKILAEKAGVALKKENPQLRTERQRLYEICDLATAFYQKQLGNGEWGKKAKEYLLGRGITEESIIKWRLGYSPDMWQGLSDFLVGRGYTRDEILRAGLAVQSEKGKQPYDRFRGRIVFPVFDLNGKPIGFGGRVFKEADKKETAKYINTPQTLLYDKSGILYGLFQAKIAVRKENQAVLTEGYTDAILCHQAGFENTVAVSGTALTSRHLQLLKRYTENLLLAFDMDVAGDGATKRGIAMAEAQGFTLKIIDTYKGAKDPADIIVENPEHWKALLDGARSIMQYYFDSAFSRFDRATAAGKKKIADIILPPIKRIPHKIEQAHWISELAQKLEVKEDIVIAQLKTLKSETVQEDEPIPVAVAEAEFKPKTNALQQRRKLLEEKIVSLLLQNADPSALFEEGTMEWYSPELQGIITPLKENPTDTVLALIEEHPAFKHLAETVQWKEEVGSPEELIGEIQLCLNQLKELRTKEKRADLTSAIKEAEHSGDQEKVSVLMKEFNTIK
jgi:DNA primase